MQTRGKFWVVGFTLTVIPIALCFVAAEVYLRSMGKRPWKVNEVTVSVTPGGKFFGKDPVLGYTHLPGKFTIKLAENYSFHVTHNENGLRVTHPPGQNLSSPRPEVWLFGCSFTHGWSVNDNETYSWRLQERFPQYEFVNFGMSGYGSLHSFLQFKKALKERPKPKMIVLAYASAHDERNAYLRRRNKELAAWNAKLGILSQPFARIEDSGQLGISTSLTSFREVPGMRHSALIHLLDQKFSSFVDAGTDTRALRSEILRNFYNLANEHKIPAVLTYIWGDTSKEMETFADSIQVPFLDITVDLEKEGRTNSPYDAHPSGISHQLYADNLSILFK